MRKTGREITLLIGAGQIGKAIVRRISFDTKVIVADWKIENAESVAKELMEAGYDTMAVNADISDRKSIMGLLERVSAEGKLEYFVNAAGVSPSQATVEAILRVDLYGTAVLLEEVGKIITECGSGLVVSSQSWHRMEPLSPEEDRLLALTPSEKLLSLDFLQPSAISDSLRAYQIAKRANVKRVMSESLRWAKRGARLNAVSPGIIVTPLALDEFSGPRGDFYRKMFASAPSGRPGTADEVAAAAELLMSDRASFITGSDLLIDGGATASYLYGGQQ